MPSIKDIKNLKQQSSLFKKKDYRPWNEDENISNSLNSINPLGVTSEFIKKENCSNEIENQEQLSKIWRGLYGAKRILLQYILENIEEKNENFHITSSITMNQLLSYSSLPLNTIKSTLQQLKRDKLVDNYENKPGIGGFARYKIKTNIYSYFIKKFKTPK